MIYLKLKKQPETLAELFTNLFTFEYSTRLKSCITYRDKECKEIECREDKYRSIDDIVEIAQTYFSAIKEEDIFKTLLYLVIEFKDRKYYPFLIHCYDIYRPTICFNHSSQNPVMNDSFSCDHMRKSDYTDWETVCGRIGINSVSELRELHKGK